jgi:hypothetical protein
MMNRFNLRINAFGWKVGKHTCTTSDTFSVAISLIKDSKDATNSAKS